MLLIAVRKIYRVGTHYILLVYQLKGGSVAEWSACRTRNPAVPGSSPALTTT